ncbi:MAG: FHA domain-containing protein [Fimbriimonas sp.]
MDRLLFIAGPMQGQRVDLAANDLTVGREPNNLVVLQGDPGVSRQHARFYSDGAHFHVVDVGSANGILVNGVRIAGPTPLRPGDIVQIASHVMRFEGGAPANPGSDPTHVFAQAPLVPTPLASPYATPPEPPLPVPAMHSPLGHPAPRGFPPPIPPHAPPHPGVVVNQQVIIPERPNNNWIGNLLGVVVLGFCLFGFARDVAEFLIPGLMLVVGPMFAIVGWMDYRRFSPYREWYEETKKALVKLVGGAVTALIGLVWLGTTLLGSRAG